MFVVLSRQVLTLFSIIAISGLGGHAFGSFKERGGEHMWLRDALPYDLNGNISRIGVARVMVYGYDSSLPLSKSFQGLDDLARSLYNSLKNVWGDSPKVRPTVFVAHSLGGLIVKEVGPLLIPSALG